MLRWFVSVCCSTDWMSQTSSDCTRLTNGQQVTQWFVCREVITIQKFLDVAARQEKSGKVRIQRFIEDLLSRIALAERLLDYYQTNGSHQQVHQLQKYRQLELDL